MEILESVDHDTFQFSKIPVEKNTSIWEMCHLWFVAFSHNLSILWSWIRLVSSFIQIFPPQHVSTLVRHTRLSGAIFAILASIVSMVMIGHRFRARVNFGSMHPPFGWFWDFGLYRQHGHGLVMDFELNHGFVRLTIDSDDSRVSWNKFWKV